MSKSWIFHCFAFVILLSGCESWNKQSVVVRDNNGKKITEYTLWKGMYHGDVVEWRQGTKERVSVYHRGKLRSRTVYFVPSGKKKTYMAFARNKVRIIKHYFPNGKKRSQTKRTLFKGKVKEVTMTWFKSGFMKTFLSKFDGKRKVISVRWYANSKKASETHFSFGKRNGKSWTWYRDGMFRLQGHYRGGKPHGRWLRWNAKGKKISRAHYRRGIPCGKWKNWDDNGKPTQSTDPILKTGSCTPTPWGARCARCPVE